MKTRIAFISMALLLCLVSAAMATPEHSGRTGEGCMTCHLSVDGGALSEKGLEYAASGYKWPPTGGFRVMGPIKKSVRLFIGYAHITAAFIWFGAILYVHLLLRPAYALKGLPRGEVMLGLASMAIVGATGILLTVSRVRGLEVLWESPWGRVLSVKIGLYLVMIGSALGAILFVGPRLKALRGKVTPVVPTDGIFGPEELSAFDGRDGRPAYVAVKGKVYDLTGSKLWKSGLHMKHHAGGDLTEALTKAPHTPEKLDAFKVVGSYDSSRERPLLPVQRWFYAIAYANLTLVFVVIFTLAVWRWGL